MEEIKNNNFEFDNSEGVSLKCLSCGSSLIFDPETQLFSCDVCHSSFTKDDLKIEALSDNDQTYDETFTEYDCPSCGAEILTDETTSTEFCAYCGNPVVLKGRINGQLKPNLIIPFKIDKDKAKEILVNELRTYSYIPNSFFNEANLDKITGIYYPFWEADLDIDCKLYAECTKVDTWVNGDKRFTRTSYYNVRRDGDIHFDDITINALKSADKSLVEGILPYPIKDHIPFNIAYLSGFYAKKNDLTFNDVKGEINQKVGNYSYDLMKNSITGYNSVKIKTNLVNVKKLHKDYTLLPIWVLNYKYNNKNYTFAINGVTGKFFGEVPISKAKLGLTFFGIFTAIFMILSLIGGLF